MSARRTKKILTVVATITAFALIAIPAALAAFSAKTENPGDIVTAAPDFVAPAITATAVAKSQGGVAGYVRKTGTYFVYANVSADTGNPASGLATVKANVAELTSGQTAATMTAGTYTAGGASYNYRSAELTANATVEGTKNYSVTATDVAGNAGTANGTRGHRQHRPDRHRHPEHQRRRRHQRPRRVRRQDRLHLLGADRPAVGPRRLERRQSPRSSSASSTTACSASRPATTKS